MTGKLARCPRKSLKSFFPSLDTIDSQKHKTGGQRKSWAAQIYLALIICEQRELYCTTFTMIITLIFSALGLLFLVLLN